MVKIVKRDLKNPCNFTKADYVNFDDFDGFSLASTKKLGPNLPKPIIRMLRSVEPVDFFQVGSMDIVSEKLKEEFVAARADCEYFEIELLKKDGTTYRDQLYYFAHLLKEIDCFDYERSEYTLWKNKDVRSVSRLVIHEDRIGSEPVFRMKNAFLGVWLAADSFVRRIQDTSMRGIVFLDFEDVNL